MQWERMDAVVLTNLHVLSGELYKHSRGYPKVKGPKGWKSNLKFSFSPVLWEDRPWVDRESKGITICKRLKIYIDILHILSFKFHD